MNLLVFTPGAVQRPFGASAPHHNLTPVRRSLIVYAAKKGGGGGGAQKKKKGAGSPADPPKIPQPYLSTPVIMQNLLLIESHFRKTGRPLFNSDLEISQAAKTLWEAPFAVLSHDTSEPEPLFVYANKVALELFETDWNEIIGTPSSRSAEPVDAIQQDRSQALSAALKDGYIDNYEGVRTSFKGTKFKISGATVFNVESPSGERVGQAAVLREWEWEDGRKGGEGVDAEAEAAISAAAEAGGPSEDEIAVAEAAVSAQAAAVRDLKETQGLANSSDEVKAAVALLMERKQELERLQAVAAAAARAAGAVPEGET